MGERPEPTGDWPPDPATLSESTFPQVLDAELRLLFRLRTDPRDRVVGFCATLQVALDTDGTGGTQWGDVARADSSHGYVHIDHLDRAGETVRKESIGACDSASEMHDAYAAACDKLQRHGRKYLRRWRAT